MKQTLFLRSLLVLTLIGAAASSPAGEQEFPDVTVDGLHRVPDSRMAVVYAEPGADLSAYRKVQLLDADVAFKKNWLRDQRRQSLGSSSVTSRDIERIKNRLSEEFRAVFTEVLEEGGYPVVDAAGEDVLLVRPAIVNLDVTAPDTMTAGRSRVYAESAGEMTLYVELYDSITGDLIAKAIDRKIDPNSGYYTWVNSVTNKAAANRILKGWADILLNALNEARE